MSSLGLIQQHIIGGEDAAFITLDLTEFKTRNQGTPDKTLNLKTPVPASTNYYIHGNVAANKQIIVDSSSALIKYKAQPLLLESEKIVSNQTEASYATLTTGFGVIYRDARVVLNGAATIGAAPFPSYMDVDSLENVVID